jgi:hypothetical protein
MDEFLVIMDMGPSSVGDFLTAFVRSAFFLLGVGVVLAAGWAAVARPLRVTMPPFGVGGDVAGVL